MDEIGDLAEPSQIKLLRLIQEREFYPVGSDTPCKSAARIVCASNKDIEGLIAAGRFRRDLYFRLNVHHVALPPLRERIEDLPLLLDHLIGRAADEIGIKKPSYPNELLNLLAIYHFPGNVRELQGMVFDAVARSRGSKLSLESFRRFIEAEKSSATPNLPGEHVVDHQSRRRMLEDMWGYFPTLDDMEDFMIDAALDAAKGNHGIAATMLGLKRPTLSMRLKTRSSRN
jgi:DNA-binding NtrC family response regulator